MKAPTFITREYTVLAPVALNTFPRGVEGAQQCDNLLLLLSLGRKEGKKKKEKEKEKRKKNNNKTF
jgi:hypothetical protein